MLDSIQSRKCTDRNDRYYIFIFWSKEIKRIDYQYFIQNQKSYTCFINILLTLFTIKGAKQKFLNHV